MSDKSKHRDRRSTVNLADYTRRCYFLHTDATLLDDLPLHKCNFYSVRLHWCVLLTLLLMTTSTRHSEQVVSCQCHCQSLDDNHNHDNEC